MPDLCWNDPLLKLKHDQEGDALSVHQCEGIFLDKISLNFFYAVVPTSLLIMVLYLQFPLSFFITLDSD